MKRIIVTALYVLAVIAAAYAVAGCTASSSSDHAGTGVEPRLPLNRSVLTEPASAEVVRSDSPVPVVAIAQEPFEDRSIRYRYDQPPSVVLGPNLARREHIRSYTYTSEYDSVTAANGFVSDYSSWRRWNWTVQRTDEQR